MFWVLGVATSLRRACSWCTARETLNMSCILRCDGRCKQINKHTSYLRKQYSCCTCAACSDVAKPFIAKSSDYNFALNFYSVVLDNFVIVHATNTILFLTL